MNTYSVTFRLKQRPYSKFRVSAPDCRVKIVEIENKPVAYHAEVSARHELTAIGAATFQIKKRLGFRVEDLHRSDGRFGLWFLHELYWDIEIKKTA